MVFCTDVTSIKLKFVDCRILNHDKIWGEVSMYRNDYWEMSILAFSLMVVTKKDHNMFEKINECIYKDPEKY